MNYIALAFKGKSDAWRYLLGFFVVIGFWQIVGAIPLLYFVFTNLENFESTAPGLAEMAQFFGSNKFFVLLMISFVAGFISLLAYNTLVHKQKLLHLTTTRPKTDWGRFFFAFFFTMALIIAYTAIGIYLNPDDYVWNFELQPFLILAAISIVLVPIQTSFEEYFFRGYLMQGIGSISKSPLVALITTSVMFGLLHIFNPEIEKIGYQMLVIYIGMGLMFGIITLLDEGLELALGLHAANNLTIALLVTADWTAFQTDSVYKSFAEPVFSESLLVFGVNFTLVLLVFGLRYNWKGWEQKLLGRVEEPEAVLEE